MRLIRFLPFLLVLPAGAWPFVDGQAKLPGAPPQQLLAEDTRSEQTDLEQHFLNLRYSETAEDASKNEAEIYIRLTASRSATVNLLLENATAALNNDDSKTARTILNEVVALDPSFAEGLTRAAALAYQDGDLDEAKRLLTRALRLEPRHFGAWTGLGQVLEDSGDLKGAQKAYREALYLHPFLDPAKRGLLRLDAKLDGLSL
jgi:Tfp pilus assembly protein PilF